MKIVAIDYGQVRTGLAATDPENILAYPLRTLDLNAFANRKDFLAELARCIEAEGAELVVIGLPLLADGSESLTTRQVRNFAKRLMHRISCPCVFMNELLSSEEALDDLRSLQAQQGRHGKGSRSRIRDVLDQQAAVRILESYLHAPDKAIAPDADSGTPQAPIPGVH